MKCFECGAETTNPKFCNRSCSAKYNNKAFPKRFNLEKIRECLECGKPTGKNGKFCSQTCAFQNRKTETIQSWLNGRQVTDAALRSSSGAYKDFVLEEQSHKCAVCGMKDEWVGKPLIFIFDHIDGNSENNIRENVRLVCPNCDTQSSTYGNRNKGNGRKLRRAARANTSLN